MEEIHDSLINGQRRQMVEQIEEIGAAEFFPRYKNYLEDLYTDSSTILKYFSDATISYFKIKNR